MVTSSNVSEGCQLLDCFRPDLVLLDLTLPDGDGFVVLGRAKERKRAVIILSGKDSEADRVAGLQRGADDYVTKPFSVGELLERVRLRLPMPQTAELIEIGGARIDLGQLYVQFRGRRTRLTRQETKLLSALWKSRGRAVSREVLLREAWGYTQNIRTRTLDYFIAVLRRKIEEDPARPQHLRTVRGVGYELIPDRQANEEDGRPEATE